MNYYTPLINMFGLIVKPKQTLKQIFPARHPLNWVIPLVLLIVTIVIASSMTSSVTETYLINQINTTQLTELEKLEQITQIENSSSSLSSTVILILFGLILQVFILMSISRLIFKIKV